MGKFTLQLYFLLFLSGTFAQDNLLNETDTVVSSINYQLVLVKKKNSNRVIQLKKGKKVKVFYSDSVKLKGRITTIYRDSVLLSGNVIPIDSLIFISKQSISATIIGNTIGTLFIGVGLIFVNDFKDYPEEAADYFVLAAGASSPFFAMNFIKRRFNLKEKWNLKTIEIQE